MSLRFLHQALHHTDHLIDFKLSKSNIQVLITSNIHPVQLALVVWVNRLSDSLLHWIFVSSNVYGYLFIITYFGNKTAIICITG